MWNFETLWQAIASSPFLWGASAIALISLAMLWRTLAHANFVRRWEVKQQLLQGSARVSGIADVSGVEASRSASARAATPENESSIAQEAALIVASGRMDMLQLQTYEDIQNPDDVQDLLFDMEIHLSNLAQLPLQVLEVSVHGDELEQPILLDAPALLRSESSHQLTQRFRHPETPFTTCHIFYMQMKQEQPQLYRLRCPLQWSEERQCYNLQVGAQQIQAVISLESQSRYHAEPSLLDNFLSNPKFDGGHGGGHAVDADALALALDKDALQEDTLVQDTLQEDMLEEYTLAQDIFLQDTVLQPDVVEDELRYENVAEVIVEDAAVANLLLDSHEGENRLETVADEGQTTVPKGASMTKVLERWFDEDPNLKELPRDSFNTNVKTESYKTSWSATEKKVTPKGSKFPEHF